MSAAKLKVVADDPEEDSVAREDAPTFKWIAVGLFPVCGVLIAAVWSSATSASAENAKQNADLSVTVGRQAERIATVETKQEATDKAVAVRLDLMQHTLDRLEVKVDKIPK